MTQTAWPDLYTDLTRARLEARARAVANGAPVALVRRDGWYTIAEEPPDEMTGAYPGGWSVVAIVEPTVTR